MTPSREWAKRYRSAIPDGYSMLPEEQDLGEFQDSPDLSQPISAAQTVPMGTHTPEFALADGSASITEAILRPESIAAIPSYLLRFVPFVGSAAVLIAAALRQAYYRTSRDRMDDNLYPKASDAVSLDVNSILRMLGDVISRAKFFRIFKDGRMDWFVTRAEPEHTFKDGHIQRLSNTYYYRGLLLTPGDASDLFTWLNAQDIRKNPTEALTRALQTSRDKILQFPFRIRTESESLVIPEPSSVHDVVRFALGDRRMDAATSSICDALAMHLIRPGSFLSIPWYWFHKVLPQLGDDLGVLYLMCKNCTYIDWAHGHDRSTFWVPGGLPTLQGWIGSETLPKRIPTKKPSRRGRPRIDEVKDNSEYVRSWREETRSLAGQYLCRVGSRHSDSGQDWQIEVYEPHLTDEDEILRDSVYTFLETLTKQDDAADLPTLLNNSTAVNLLHKAARNETNDSICHFDTLVDKEICHFDTLDPELIGHFDTLVTALKCHFETQPGTSFCHFDTVINILIRLKHTDFLKNCYKPPHTSVPEGDADPEEAVVAGYFVKDEWHFEQLLARVNPILAARVMERVPATAFVSWLILGSLTNVIKSPLSFAVSRAVDLGTSAGGAPMRLAEMTPASFCQQMYDLSQRLQAGYLGNSLSHAPIHPDLRELLDAAESQAEKMRLLIRLMDVLGIHVR